MNGRNGFDGRGQEIDVLYQRANERIAKGVALVGAYLIWGVLGLLTVGVLLLGA